MCADGYRRSWSNLGKWKLAATNEVIVIIVVLVVLVVVHVVNVVVVVVVAVIIIIVVSVVFNDEGVLCGWPCVDGSGLWYQQLHCLDDEDHAASA